MPSSDHVCDTNDIAIAKHTSTVRDVLRSTPLLETIQSAHAYQRSSTEKPEPINMVATLAGLYSPSGDYIVPSLKNVLQCNMMFGGV